MAEEAPEAAGSGRGLGRNVPVLSLSFFALTLGNGLWLSLLSIYLDSLGFSPFLIGLTLTSYNAAMSLVFLPSGRLSDMVGRRVPLLLGCLTVAAGTLLLRFAHTAEVMIPLLIVVGVGQGLMGPSSTALIAESVAPSKSGLAFSVYFIASISASMVGSASSGILAGLFGYERLFLAAGLLGFASLAALYLLVREPSGRWNGSLGSAVQRSLRDSLSGTVFLLRSQRDLLFLAVALSFHTFGLSMINPYVTLFAKEAVNMSLAEAGFMMSFQSLGLLVAQVPFGNMTDRFGARAMLLAHFVLSSLSWSFYAGSTSAPVAYVTVLFFGVIGAMDMPARRTLMMEYSSEKVGKATVVGSLDAIIGLSGIAAPTIGGLAWSSLGYKAPFHLAATLNIGASIPLVMLLKRRRPKPKDSP
ncbi:MAG: MFS transporter [Candidatus Bathyarchaeia archaeon]